MFMGNTIGDDMTPEQLADLAAYQTIMVDLTAYSWSVLLYCAAGFAVSVMILTTVLVKYDR